MSLRKKFKKLVFMLNRKAINRSIINEYSADVSKLQYLSERDLSIYKKNFERTLQDYASQPDRQEMMRKIIVGFYQSDITSEKISFHKDAVGQDDVTLITVVKNDIPRCKLLFSYYRNLGIRHFIVLDNNSDDGTFEWLMEQPDINLYRCQAPYETYRKEAWVNRLISTCGFNRWYLIVDSDELVDYIGSDRYSISDLAKMLRQRNETRGKGMLIDMYSENDLFQTECEYSEIPEKFCYYDLEGYRMVTDGFVDHWEGGPRERVLGTKHIWVSKSPLVYYDEDTLVINAHFQYPISVGDKSPDVFFIRHYKYLKSDYKAFAERVKKGNFANGSQFYKTAIEGHSKGEAINFMHEKSKKYISSIVNIPGFYDMKDVFEDHK